MAQSSSSSGNGGAVDPVSAIAMAVGDIAKTVGSYIQGQNTKIIQLTEVQNMAIAGAQQQANNNYQLAIATSQNRNRIVLVAAIAAAFIIIILILFKFRK